MACVICAHNDEKNLPSLPQSMVSDGAIFPHPLDKKMCMHCGFASYITPKTLADLGVFYHEGYNLGATANVASKKRAENYATWIENLMTIDPQSLLEIGCSNGELLDELSTRLHNVKTMGVETAKKSSALAASKGHLILNDYFENSADKIDEKSLDLLVSVNVIEHCLDPVLFLQKQKKLLSDKGQIIVICPHSDEPNLEILFADHLSSFTEKSLQILGETAGLKVEKIEKAPHEIGEFQACVFSLNHDHETATPCHLDTQQLFETRSTYIKAWDKLDNQDSKHTSLYMFGAGEMACLIRCYAPHFWNNIQGIIIDNANDNQALGKPLYDTEELKKKGKECDIFIAVRPDIAPKIEEKIAPYFRSVSSVHYYINK